MDDALRQLEQDLAHRPQSQPSSELRARVLQAVAKERRQEQKRGLWQFAASVAAVFVVWMNLSWFASRETPVLGPQATTQASLDEMAEQIRRLLPEISQHEARRQALLLRGCSDWRPAASLPVSFVLETNVR